MVAGTQTAGVYKLVGADMGKKRGRKVTRRGPAPLSWDMARKVQSGEVAGELPEDFNGPGFRTTQGPTDALPGSEEKIAVLAARARRREQLFHPNDNLGHRDEPPGEDFLAALSRAPQEPLIPPARNTA